MTGPFVQENIRMRLPNLSNSNTIQNGKNIIIDHEKYS